MSVSRKALRLSLVHVSEAWLYHHYLGCFWAAFSFQEQDTSHKEETEDGAAGSPSEWAKPLEPEQPSTRTSPHPLLEGKLRGKILLFLLGAP